MIKLSHPILAIISGAIWLTVGLWLLPLGLNFLIEGGRGDIGNYPLIQFFSSFAAPESAAVFLIAMGLLIGNLKGKFVLGKSARKGVERIRNLSNPAPLTKIYSAKYYLLLGGMVLLGLSIKWLGLPLDIRGLVDVAIGAALIRGALIYFREAALLARPA